MQKITLLPCWFISFVQLEERGKKTFLQFFKEKSQVIVCFGCKEGFSSQQKKANNSFPAKGFRFTSGYKEPLFIPQTTTNTSGSQPERYLTCYTRGGLTFLIAGQILKLFCISAAMFIITELKVTTSAKQKFFPPIFGYFVILDASWDKIWIVLLVQGPEK